MSSWKAAKARRVLAALKRLGWQEIRRSGSHRTLSRAGWPEYTWSFHEQDEIGPVMLSRIAKKTGLQPGDL